MSEKIIVACPNCQTRFVAPLEKFLPTGRKVRCAKCENAWFHSIEGHPPTGQNVEVQNPEPAGRSEELPVRGSEKPHAEQSQSIMDRAIAKTTAPIDRHPNQINTNRERRSIPPTGQGISSTVAAAGAAVVGGGAAVGAAVADATQVDESLPDLPQGAELSRSKPRKRRWFPRILFYSIAIALVAGALGYFFKDEIVARVPALDSGLTSWKRNVDAVVSKVIPPNRSLRIDNVKYDVEEADGETALLVTADVINDSSALKTAPNLVVKVLGQNDAVLNEASLAPEEASSEIAGGDRTAYFLRMPNPPPGLRRVEVDFAK